MMSRQIFATALRTTSMRAYAVRPATSRILFSSASVYARGFATRREDETAGMMEKVKQSAQNAMSMAKDAIGLGDTSMQDVSSKAKDFAESGKKAASEASNWTKQEPQEPFFVGEIASKATEAVKNMASKAKEKMPTPAQLADKVLDTMGDVANKAKQVIGSAMPPTEELKEDIASKAETAKEKVKEGYSEATKKAQKHMPSKADLKSGAQNVTGKVIDAASATVEGAKNMAKGAASAAKDTLEKEGVKRKAKIAERYMEDTMISVADKAKETARSAAEGARKLAEDIAQDSESGERPEVWRSEEKLADKDIQKYEHFEKGKDTRA